MMEALDSRLLQQIFEVLNSPPPTGKYKAIKEAKCWNEKYVESHE